MCPFRYLYHVILFLVSNALLASCVEWKAIFNPSEVTVKTASKQNVHLVLSGISDEIIANLDNRDYVQLKSENDELATVKNQHEITFRKNDTTSTWNAFFDVSGIFLGSTKVFVEIKSKAGIIENSNEKLNVTVLRPQRVIDRMFTYSVIILVSILYINFGAAINVSTISDILRKPVGPAICFVCQFLFMPLIAYGLGIALFPKAHEMALGLFFTGISPGGGASNMWTLLLGGNINLVSFFYLPQFNFVIS